MIIAEQTTKLCGGCNRDLAFTAEFFARDRSKANGLSSRCRDCKNKVDRNKKKRDSTVVRIEQAQQREHARLKRVAYDNACDQLVKTHPYLFQSFLYTQYVQLGIVTINERDKPKDMRYA